MITKEKLFIFAEKYRENTEKYIGLSDSLLRPCSREEWLELLRERSEVTREIFAQNEEWLPLIYSEMEQMTMEQAQIFYDSLMNVFFDRFRSSDYPLMIDIAEKILPFFEESGDTERVVRLCAILVYWYDEYYGREMGVESAEAPLRYADKIIDAAKDYVSINDKEARLRFFRTYSNMIGVMPELYHIPPETVTGWYNDMEALWSSEIVQTMDGDDEDFIAETEWVRSGFLDYCCSIAAEMPENKAAYERCLEYIEKTISSVPCEEMDPVLLRSKRLLDLKKGLSTADELIRLTLSEIEALPAIDFTLRCDEENLDIFDELIMSVIFIWRSARLDSFEDAEKRKLSRQLVELFMEQARRIPGSAYTDYVNDVYADIFREALPYLDTFEEKEELLEKLIISRQPLTFVHSYMVERTAEILGAAVVDDSPELLAGMPGFEDADKVLSRRGELLRYLGKCGALHDIGKCTIAGVINMQTRKVNDREFSCIRQHPPRGISVLRSDPLFAEYIPIIQGHHRSYDGKRGYPDDFDILSSPYKPAIDLISICDSLDAATDRFGRNYNKAKDFDAVLAEFKEGAGSRYSPGIVAIIERNTKLQDKLRYMTTEGRAEAYYTAYRKCQELSSLSGGVLADVPQNRG